MSSLAGQRPSDSYGFLLQVDGGVTSSPKTVQDGSGNDTPLQLSSLAVTANALQTDIHGNLKCSNASGVLANIATDGFGYMPTVSGTPTGTPRTIAGFVPFVFDTAANKLWIYTGSWKSVTLS